MRHYLYISTAMNLGDSEIAAILDSCQRNNAARHVTGMLLYNGRNFMQLLEGEPDDLYYIMRRISADVRHEGISVLADNEVEHRLCPDWLMRLIPLAKRVEDRRAALEEQLPDGLESDIKSIMLNFVALN